ncbi:hypothetical protein NL676_026512 [Syzygium grande]|nr:hypothetical protein NL676_026512 [Syzygium grande]
MMATMGFGSHFGFGVDGPIECAHVSGICRGSVSRLCPQTTNFARNDKAERIPKHCHPSTVAALSFHGTLPSKSQYPFHALLLAPVLHSTAKAYLRAGPATCTVVAISCTPPVVAKSES